jgi:hypothetical protein
MTFWITAQLRKSLNNDGDDLRLARCLSQVWLLLSSHDNKLHNKLE